MTFYIQDESGLYHIDGPITEHQVLSMASEIAQSQLPGTDALTSPDSVRRYLSVKLSHLEHEVFACLWLDNQHRCLNYEEVFRGTIDGATVYPREIVKCALHKNAAAVVFVHNHPSGVSDPSEADRRITERLTAALDLINVRVLDHLVVGMESTTSFAERGLI